MRPATALFVAAIALTLVVGYLLRDTPGFVVRNPDGSYQGDIVHYVYWTRLVTLDGIQAAYSGQWPETYAVYPPVTLYGYQLLGTLYRATQDARFSLEAALGSPWLREGIKAVALAWHLLAALAIYALVRRRSGADLAGLAAALYVANPAALFDVAHWAQPDGAHSVFSVLAVGLISIGNLEAGWAAIALAALAKPQAVATLPLMAIATLRQSGGVAGLVRGGLVGCAVGALVILPFALTGHLRELLSLPGAISSVMPVVSADAHNLWWLLLEPRGIEPLFTTDTARLGGPVSFRLAAGALVVAQFVLSYWLYWTHRGGLAEAAALGVLGWFVFTTQAHENHLFLALPLLALAWPTRRGLLLAYAVLTATVLLNMALHDQLLLEALGRSLDDGLVQRLRLLNAAANVLCFLSWSLAAALRRPGPASVPASRPGQRGGTSQLLLDGSSMRSSKVL